MMDPTAPNAQYVSNSVVNQDLNGNQVTWLSNQSQNTAPNQYADLINKYGNSIEDITELANLLNSWNLIGLCDFFLGKFS